MLKHVVVQCYRSQQNATNNPLPFAPKAFKRPRRDGVNDPGEIIMGYSGGKCFEPTDRQTDEANGFADRP